MKFMKVFMIVAVVVAALGMSQSASAQLYTYTSGYQVQNLSDQPADITIDYYDQQTSATAGGAQAKSVPDTIDGLKSKTYFPIHTSTGFKGSVVISSSTPLASIVNLVANGVGNASYIGSSQGSKSVSLPLLMKGNAGYTTWYSVQNTGSANANVSVSYSDGTTASQSIKPNAAFVFDQGKETHSKAVFAATITSDQPIVAVVVQEGAKAIMAQSGFDSGETTAYMPLINANNGGLVTGIQVQNMGDQATDITITYTPTAGGGTGCTEKRTVNPHASATFALAAFGGSAGADVSNCVNAKFVGGAQITGNSANQPVVAVVNQVSSKLAGAYDSFTPSKVTGKVVLPLLMDRNAGWSTGFTVANVGSQTITVTCTFTNSTVTKSAQLAPGEVMLDLQTGELASKYVGSGTCTATGGDNKIVAVVNQVNGTATGDNLMVYEGINVAP